MPPSIRALIFLFPFACFAAKPLPAEIESAIDLTRGVTGEFGADGLIRIAALEQIPLERRVQLLEEAFARAAEAQQPFKRRSGMGDRSSNAAFLDHAFRQDLDTLSLRVRAIQAMLPLDVKKARQLYTDIPPINLPTVGCDDFLVYDVDRYYEALPAVVKQAFTPREIHDGVQYQFLADRVGLITSPAQLAPAAKAILAAGLNSHDFPGAVAAFTSALRKISGDDRSFTYYLPAAGEAVQALAEESRRRATPPLPVIEAYREYLVHNFSAQRCADNDPQRTSDTTGASGLPSAVDQTSADAMRFFNQSLVMQPLQPIQWAEATPPTRKGTAAGLQSCESGECQMIAQQYRGLVLDSTGAALPNATRETTEWREQLLRFLDSLASWQETIGPEAAQQFREKASLYSEVFQLTTDHYVRQRAIRADLEFLQRSHTQSISRIEWILPVNTLIGRIGLEPLGLGRAAEDLRRSPDAVIALYSTLERIAPRDPGSILHLM